MEMNRLPIFGITQIPVGFYFKFDLQLKGNTQMGVQSILIDFSCKTFKYLSPFG